MARRRLDQVDAMRPIKQAGVISTHSVLYFAPAAASVGSGAALLLLHVSREGFFFISACMLTYAYADLGVGGLRRYYGRRCLSVVIPYLCWTVIYFLYLLPTSHYVSRPTRPQEPGLDGVHGVLPAVLPAGDHAVLPGLPARADAAAADQGTPRPGHRRRRAGPGGDLDHDALGHLPDADDQVRPAGCPDLPALPDRRRCRRLPS